MLKVELAIVAGGDDKVVKVVVGLLTVILYGQQVVSTGQSTLNLTIQLSHFVVPQ